MKVWTGFLCAMGLFVATGAWAGPPPPAEFEYEPFFTGKFDDYGFGVDLVGIKAKTAKIAKDCFRGVRGARLQVKQVPQGQPKANGFFSLFNDANQKRQPVDIQILFDVSKLDGVDSRAAFELDSPFVPVGGPAPTAFVILAVNREANQSLNVFVATPGGNVGTPLVLPADTETIIGHLTYDGGLVDVEAAACDAPAPTPLATAVPLAFDGGAGVGAGITGEKGDAAGFSFIIRGDIYDAAKQDLLEDLQAVIDLENDALDDLAASQNADARTKTEQARARLEDQGPEVDPPTVPATFEPDLLEKAGGIADEQLREEVVKRLTKAAQRDAKARDAIDGGTPKDLTKAAKELDKARQEKVRAKAMIETGVIAEGKGARM